MHKCQALLLMQINNEDNYSEKNQSCFFILCNLFTNHTTAVTLGKSIKIGCSCAKFEL